MLVRSFQRNFNLRWSRIYFNKNIEICNFHLAISNLFLGFQNMMHATQDVTVGQISLIWEEKRLGSWMHYAWWMLAGVITTWYEFIIRLLMSCHTTQYWWANLILCVLNWFRRRVRLVLWKRTHFVAIPLPLVIHARTLIATQMEIASQKRLKDWLKLWQTNHDMEWKFWKYLTTSFVFGSSSFFLW